MKENKIQIHKLNSIEVKSLSFKYKTAKLFWPKTTRKAEKLRGPKQEKKRNWPRAGRHAIHLPPVGISGHWKMKFTAVFVFLEIIFQTFLCLFVIRKLINKKNFQVDGKHFPIKEKFNLVSGKVFFFYFGWKTLSRICEKFRNVILFADYIKFDPQTFDCYIYIYIFFCFEYLFFNFIP
jgi:hypothetical protein